MSRSQDILDRLKSPSISINEQMNNVLAHADEDAAFKQMLLSRLGVAPSSKSKTLPFPSDPDRIEISIWDNQFGRRVSKVENRYACEVQAYSGKMVVFKGRCDFYSDSLRQRAKRWKQTDAEEVRIETLANAYRYVGRLWTVGARGEGNHTHVDHFVACDDPGNPTELVLIVDGREVVRDLPFVDTGCEGKPFAKKKNRDGSISRVIWQLRWSKKPTKTWSSV